MSNKILALAVILVSFAAGRYSATSTTKEIKHDELVKVDTELHKERDMHTTTRVRTIKEPSGVVTTESVVETTVSAHTDSIVQATDSVHDTSVTISKSNAPKTNISALASVDFKEFKPIYGVSVSKEVLGPVTIGLFGFSSGMLGISVGVSF